ncbi:Ff.00g077790.m01.CDS01 [Fusarium sp. VM40]|nr:Ff.00g077790.m01.CDS01 [Fusarium sp. VM40]
MSSLLESLGLRHEVALVAIAAGIFWFVVYEWMRKSKAAKPEIPAWKTPSPKPLIDFDLDSKTPQLYRPCRHGPNHVTMGIRKLDWNNWIEMDSNFLWYHDLKVSELNKDIDAHVQYVDNAVTRDACFEVLEELTAYLTARYPKIFQLNNGILRNTLTGETFDYPATWESANNKGLTIDDLYFRSERQSLRRLPRSKALLFTIRTYFEPITTIAREPHVPGRLAEAIDNWDEEHSTYKGKHNWANILLPYLHEQDELQKKAGVLEKIPEGSFPY